MKNLTILIFALLFINITAISQSCLPEGIVFNFQVEIDNFQINYPGCTEIEGEVGIHGDWITNLNGLNVLTSIGGNLEIGYMWIYEPHGNLQLTNLTGLDNLTTIGGNLQIVGNENLLSLSGLENLTSIEGSLIIGWPWTNFSTGGNQSLTNITALNNLSFVGGEIGIYYNGSLTSLSGLNIETCTEGLYIISNDTLSDLTGLDNVTSTGGDLELSGNAAMTSLTGLEGLTSIGGQLGIHDNAALSSLTGLENLTYIANGLTIGDDGFGMPGNGNPLLTSLAGLNNLTSIGGSLSINENEILTSLTGLDNIQAETISDLIIINNSSLSTCEVYSVCSYLSSPNGTIEIHDNAPGCNNPEEVDSLCNIVSVNEFNVKNEFSISPNPIESNAVLTYTLNKRSNVTLKIHDLSGQLVETLVNEYQQQGEQKVIFKSNGLKPGVYFCELKTNEGIQTRKMIKL